MLMSAANLINLSKYCDIWHIQIGIKRRVLLYHPSIIHSYFWLIMESQSCQRSEKDGRAQLIGVCTTYERSVDYDVGVEG